MNFDSIEDSPFNREDRVDRDTGDGDLDTPSRPQREPSPEPRHSGDEGPQQGASVVFEVPGRPHGKKRPKLSTRGGKPHSYQDPETERYETKVGHCARKARPDQWPTDAEYRLSVQALYPDRRFADLSNIVKAIEDGAEDVLYDDDRQIAEYGRCRRTVSDEVSDGAVLVKVEVLS